MKYQITDMKFARSWTNYTEETKATVIEKSELTNEPFNAIGKLYTSESKYAIQLGSAFKVSDYVAMTAAHCLCKVHDGGEYINYFEDFEFCPMFPYYGQTFSAKKSIIPNTYLKDQGISNDIGFLIFDEILPGETLNLEINVKNTGQCVSMGYPDSENYFGNELMAIKGNYKQPYLEPFIVMANNDMTTGCSGGPIFDINLKKVISLNSKIFGRPSKEQMAGPILREPTMQILQEIINNNLT